MPKKSFHRTDRVAQLIQTELSKIIQQEMHDPRMGMVTVTGVDVTRDLAYAKIYVSVLTGDESDVDVVIKTLNESGKLLRFRLANEVSLRSTPQLKFIYDDSIVEGNKLSSLISTLIQNEKDDSDS